MTEIVVKIGTWFLDAYYYSNSLLNKDAKKLQPTKVGVSLNKKGYSKKYTLLQVMQRS